METLPELAEEVMSAPNFAYKFVFREQHENHKTEVGTKIIAEPERYCDLYCVWTIKIELSKENYNRKKYIYIKK